MSKLPVKNIEGESIGDFEIADQLLEYKKGKQALFEAVVAHRARQRAGTASTLSKSEVAGSGKKPWKQKGTGRARAGYQQSPIWRGGAQAFGPKPRSFNKKENRKTARLAFRRALSEKISHGQIIVIESLDLGDAKTRSVAGLLGRLDVGRRTLLVPARLSESLHRASRNIPNVGVAEARQVTAYDLLYYTTLVVTREGMDVLVERLQDSPGRTE